MSIPMQDFQARPSFTMESRADPAIKRERAAREQSGKRVLVMDDEMSILDLTTRLLGSAGYEVEVATDGAAAVKQYQAALEAGRRFDVLILDLTVPEKMGGYDAFKAIQIFDPAVKVILSSGYSHEPIVLNYRQYGIAGVAPKPYRVRDLLGTVEGVLREG